MLSSARIRRDRAGPPAPQDDRPTISGLPTIAQVRRASSQLSVYSRCAPAIRPLGVEDTRALDDLKHLGEALGALAVGNAVSCIGTREPAEADARVP